MRESGAIGAKSRAHTRYASLGFFALLCGIWSQQAFSFSLNPRDVDDESDSPSAVQRYFEDPANIRTTSHLPFLDGSRPLHEDLTQKSLGCGIPASPCERLKAIGVDPKYIIEGVRSNDFPALYLTFNAAPWCKKRVLRIHDDRDVACILGSFAKAATNGSKFRDPKWSNQRPFGMRGHFGDLQFLHAMAPEGQEAGVTYKGIAAWMEFAYRASRDEFKLTEDVWAVAPQLRPYFLRGARKAGDLLNYRFDSQRARGVALGQMLHIAQDSFSSCHAVRNADGKLVQFLSYENQDKHKHGRHDKEPELTHAALNGAMNPVTFGERVLAFRADNVRWEDGPKQLVQEYFFPESPSRRAEAGAHCI